MTDEKRARLLAYGNNIARYSRASPPQRYRSLSDHSSNAASQKREKAIALIRSGDPLPTRMAIPARGRARGCLGIDTLRERGAEGSYGYSEEIGEPIERWRGLA